MGTKEYHKEYYQNNKDKLNKYGKEWHKKNPNYQKRPEVIAKKKEWYQKNPDYYKSPERIIKRNEYRQRPEVKLKIKGYRYSGGYLKKYGLTIEDYNKLVKQQDGVCAICGNNETVKQNGKETKLAVDHDWKTGKIRGLLCKNCNVSLGNLNEDISLFYKCIEYLKQHSN